MIARSRLADVCTIAIFLAGLISKVLVLWHEAPAAHLEDMVTGLPRLELICAGAVLDGLGLLAFCSGISRTRRGICLVWIGSCFLAYHLSGLFFWGKGGCDCLSGLQKAAGGPKELFGALPLLLSCYLLWRGFGLLQLERQSEAQRIMAGLERLCQGSRRQKVAAIGLLCVCFATAGLILLNAPLGSALQFYRDEELELTKASLLKQGFGLYRQIWSDQPPLLSYAYAGLLKIFGDSALVPRLLSVGSLAVILLATGSHLLHRRGMIAAALFVLLFPTVSDVLPLSVSAVQEVPLTCVALLGVLAGLRFTAHPSLGRAALSWTVLAAAFAIKFTAVLFLVPLIGAVLWNCVVDKTRRGKLLAFASALCVLPAAVLLLEWGFFGHDSVYQTVATHFSWKLRSIPEAAGQRFQWSFVLSYPALYTLAFLSALWLLLFGGWKNCMFELLLGGGMILFALIHRPWWSYYQVEFGVALCLVSAVGFSDYLAKCCRWALTALAPGLISPVAAVWAGVLAATVLLFAGLQHWGPSLRYMTSRVSRSQSDGVRFLQPFRGKVKWVFTPRSIYAFHAGLQIPPELAVLSRKRFWTGQITAEGIRGLLRQYRPEAVVLDPQKEAELLTWINRAEYVEVGEGRDCVLYLRRGRQENGSADGGSESGLALPGALGAD